MTKILQSIPYPTYTTAERDLLVDVLKNTYINNSDTGKVEEMKIITDQELYDKLLIEHN